MKRRQFLKAMLAVPAVAMLPTGYGEEEVWANVVTLGEMEPNSVSFVVDGLKAGDYISVGGCSTGDTNGIYEVMRVEGGVCTVEQKVIPESIRRSNSRRSNPVKLRGRRSGRKPFTDLHHVSGRKGVGRDRGRWRTHSDRRVRVHSKHFQKRQFS